MWMALLLNRYTAAGLVVMTVLGAVFVAGDKYGWNARHYAQCKAETARRNADVAKVNASEEARHAEEEAKRKAARTAFDKTSIGQCLLTGDMAAALNGIGE
jgi:hypothetical protein